MARNRKWLQDVFDVPLAVMLTDDEKVLVTLGYERQPPDSQEL